MVKILVIILQMLGRENIIQKLADSYPIRRAAQLSVYLYSKTRPAALEFKNFNQIAEKLKKITKEK